MNPLIGVDMEPFSLLILVSTREFKVLSIVLLEKRVTEILAKSRARYIKNMNWH